jgi:phosphohistidine phosphatase SixA
VSSQAYLVRHAEAAAEAGGNDAERRLTARGRAAFERLAAALAPELQVRRILSSPFLRARETARILGKVTGAPVEPSDDLA